MVANHKRKTEVKMKTKETKEKQEKKEKKEKKEIPLWLSLMITAMAAFAIAFGAMAIINRHSDLKFAQIMAARCQNAGATWNADAQMCVAKATDTTDIGTTPSSESEILSEKTIIPFGDTVGAFHLTPNENELRWELNWDERYRTSPGLSCKEVTQKGASGSFIMPGNGYINSVVGDIIVNGIKWGNGNPVTGPNGQQIIAEGSNIDFRFYGTDSDCLAIWIPYK